MEIIFEQLFVDHLKNCPAEFQNHFRYYYELLKQASNLKEVEGVKKLGTSKTDYKLVIGKCRIGMQLENSTVTFVCFIFNPYLK